MSEQVKYSQKTIQKINELSILLLGGFVEGDLCIYELDSLESKIIPSPNISLILRVLRVCKDSDGFFDEGKFNIQLAVEQDNSLIDAVNSAEFYGQGFIDYARNMWREKKVLSEDGVEKIITTIKTLSANLQTATLLAQYAQQIITGNLNAEQIVSQVNNALIDINKDVVTAPETVKELVSEWREYTSRLREYKEQYGTSGVPVFMPGLEDGSVSEGGIIIIGGSAGAGKTSLVMRQIYDLVSRDIPVLLFSLEINPVKILDYIIYYHVKELDEITKQYARKNGGQPKLYNWTLQQIRNRDLSEDDIEDVLASLSARDYPIYIYGTKNVRDVEDLLRLANMAIHKYGVKAVFLDFLQILVKPRNGQQHLQYEDVMNKIQVFANEKLVPFVIVSQLTKASQNDAQSVVDPFYGASSMRFLAETAIVLNRVTVDNAPDESVKTFIEALPHGVQLIAVYYNKTRYSAQSGSTSYYLFKFGVEIVPINPYEHVVEFNLNDF